MKDKDSAINDLNEKLMKRMNECQVLREENATARESLHLSTDREVKQHCPYNILRRWYMGLSGSYYF
jgi:hypothetical protein